MRGSHLLRRGTRLQLGPWALLQEPFQLDPGCHPWLHLLGSEEFWLLDANQEGDSVLNHGMWSCWPWGKPSQKMLLLIQRAECWTSWTPREVVWAVLHLFATRCLFGKYICVAVSIHSPTGGRWCPHRKIGVEEGGDVCSERGQVCSRGELISLGVLGQEQLNGRHLNVPKASRECRSCSWASRGNLQREGHCESSSEV